MMNIIGNDEILDDFYRYKRPKFIINYIGKGNKNKTILKNIDDICIAIKRSLSEVMKFYCYELGTSYKIVDNNHTLKGEFDIQILDLVLHKYIELFILCTNCTLPSTFYKIKKICSACGYIDLLPFEHKLVEYILKNKTKIDFNINCQNYK